MLRSLLRPLTGPARPLLLRCLLSTATPPAPTATPLGGPRRPLRCCRLPQRRPLRLRGPETASFLQGLVTNDLNHLVDVDDEETTTTTENDDDEEEEDSSSAPPPPKRAGMYSLFLNTQGRIMYDVILFRGPEPHEFIVDCDLALSDQLMKHLKMYKVRRKIHIEKMDGHEAVAVFAPDSAPQTDVLASSTSDLPGSIHCDLHNNYPTRQEMERHFASDDNVVVGCVDPRVRELGYRLVVRQGYRPNDDDDWVEDDSSYTDLRYRLGVSEGSREIPPAKCFPLEYNADYMHGVSFHKGCYIGQELTARTHHTGVVRKRIMPVELSVDYKSTGDDSLQESTTDANFLSAKGKKIGKLRASAGRRGLGLMRVAETLAEDEGRVRLEASATEGGDSVTEADVKATVAKPHWWPHEAPKRIAGRQAD